MVAGITDEVEVGSSYKETSGGSDGAGAEETAIELILTFFLLCLCSCQDSPIFKSCFPRH